MWAVGNRSTQNVFSCQKKGNVNNNNGELVEGCIYDEETGLLYIPKDLYMGEEGKDIFSMQTNIRVDKGMDKDALFLLFKNFL